MIALEPLGDRAFVARFDTEDRAAGWSRTVRSAALPGVLDVVLAYRSVAVFADPDRADLDFLAAELSAFPADDFSVVAPGRTHRVPVLYDGPDLAGSRRGWAGRSRTWSASTTAASTP